MFLPCKIIEEKLLKILSEDTGEGDVTSSLLIPADLNVEASVIAKELGIVAGVEEARILLQSLGIEVEASLHNGAKTKSGFSESASYVSLSKGQSIMSISPACSAETSAS
jgi:nicotinate-nucleotide pyrophosphorylase